MAPVRGGGSTSMACVPEGGDSVFRVEMGGGGDEEAGDGDGHGGEEDSAHGS